MEISQHFSIGMFEKGCLVFEEDKHLFRGLSNFIITKKRNLHFGDKALFRWSHGNQKQKGFSIRSGERRSKCYAHLDDVVSFNATLC